MTANARDAYPWLWDLPMPNETFDAILRGDTVVGACDRLWAALRLIEYAPYRDIRRRLSDAAIRELWPTLAPRVRSASRRAGMDFLCARLNGKAA